MKFFTVATGKFKNSIFAKEGFLKNVATLAGATAFGQIVSVLGSLILTRLYTPEDFGILAIFTSLLSQLLVFASLRYEWAIPLPKNDQTAVDLLVLCFTINCGITALIGIGVLVGGHQIAIWSNAPGLEPFIRFLPLLLFFAGCYRAFNYWGLRKKAFGAIARTKLAQSLLTTGSQISLGLMTNGAFGLIVGTVLHSGVGIGGLALSFWQDWKARLKNVSIGNLSKVSRKYSRFPTFSVWSSFCNSAGLAAPALLLAFFYDPTAVGSFAVAQRVTSIPATFIGSSISQVFLANAYSLIHQDPHQLKHLHRRMTFLLLGIGLCIGLGLLFSPWVFPLLFGEKWHSSGVMAQYMALMFVASLTVSSLSILEWLDKQDWMLVWNVIRLVFIYLGFFFADAAQWSASSAIAVFSLIMTIMYGLLLAMNFYGLNLHIKKHLSQSISEDSP